MAKATANCICLNCGKAFTVTKTCQNRSDANQFEAYAENRYNECPECYAERMKTEREKKNRKDAAKAAEIMELYHFPAVIGRTEKQTRYADDLRNKYIAETAARQNSGAIFENFEKYLRIRDTEDYKSKIKECAPKFGGDMDKAETAILEYGGIDTLVKLYKNEDARTIIDTLK